MALRTLNYLFRLPTGKTIDDMIVNLTKVFDRLTAAGLKLKPSKCHLLAKTVEYLGHIITETGVSTDPSKIEVVKNWPEPTKGITIEVISWILQLLWEVHKRFCYRCKTSPEADRKRQKKLLGLQNVKSLLTV